MIRRSRRSWAALALAALLVHAVVAALAGASPGGRKAPADSRPAGSPATPARDPFARRTQKVTDRVWLIDRPVATDAPFEGNVVVIEQSDGLVVVDAGGAPPAGREVVRHIRALSAKPVKAIVYTHYHGDHNLGAGALLEAWPRASVISTEATKRHMLGKPMAYIETYAESYGRMADHARTQATNDSLSESERRGWERFAAAGPGMVAGYTALTAYPATRTFTTRLDLPDEVAPIEIAFLGRANTDGDAVIWAPKQRVLSTGDIVVHPIPYASACFPGEWIAVLKRIKTYDFAFLVPGHGEVQTDRRYVDQLIWGLGEVRSRVGPLAKRGVPLDSVRKVIDLSRLRETFAGDDGWTRFVMDAVFTADIVRNVWQEARGDSIVQGGG